MVGLAVATAAAHAAPIGTNNYDFATFDPAVVTSDPAHYGGWTQVLADANGDRRLDRLAFALDATSARVWTSRSNGDGSFATATLWQAAGNWVGWTLAMADVDGDGADDIVLRAADQTGWRSAVARSQRHGTFAAPVAWRAAGAWTGWTPLVADATGDRRADLLLCKVDATGWHIALAVGDGAGRFGVPVQTAFAVNAGDWRLGIGDFNGDGRIDLSLDASDQAGWRSWVALARAGATFAAPVAWSSPGDHSGLASARGDFNADGRTDLLLWAADATSLRAEVALADGTGGFIAPVAWMAPAAGPGWTLAIADVNGDRGADLVLQRPDATGWQARVAVVVGPDGELDQTQMVSRAVEILDSTAIRIANSHLVGPGKQLLHIEHADDTVVEASRLDCYYFCVDARDSTIELRRSAFRAEHVNPADTHALLWTDHATQRYLNCTMTMVTGKSLFAGVNDFATDTLEVAGSTEVSAAAEAWVSQHPNYDGINLVVRGSFPALADWYFIDFMGGGWQASSQICYEPASAAAYCVSHFE